MKILLLTLLLFLPFWVTAEEIDGDTITYQYLLDEIEEDAPMRVRTSEGVIREIDLVDRTITVGGYLYYVGPSYGENSLTVNLYGTTAGSFELLKTDMNVQVIYADFGFARAAFELNELDPDLEVEH